MPAPPVRPSIFGGRYAETGAAQPAPRAPSAPRPQQDTAAAAEDGEEQNPYLKETPYYLKGLKDKADLSKAQIQVHIKNVAFGMALGEFDCFLPTGGLLNCPCSREGIVNHNNLQYI